MASPVSPVLKPITGNWNFCGLDWSPYPEEGCAFAIQRKLHDAAEWDEIVSGLTLQAMHSPVQAGVTFDYRITASKAGEASDPSNMESFTGPVRPSKV